MVVVASPMRADDRSRARLTAKVKGYLGALEALHATGTAERSSVVVKIHKASDPAVFSLLDGMRSWVEEYGASLVVEPIG